MDDYAQHTVSFDKVITALLDNGQSFHPNSPAPLF